MDKELTVEQFFRIIKDNFKKIILFTLMGMMITALYTFFFVTPQYESKSTIVVNQTQNTSQTITNTDIQTNLNLISTYQRIIKEPIILQEVIDMTDSNLTVSGLRNKITVLTENSSLVFDVVVIDSSPYVAAELANAIAGSFESKIGDILEVESVTILSQAEPNLNAVSPNIPENIIIGLILGMMIGIGFSLLAEFMDNTVKGSQFINEKFGWTDLGTISHMSDKEIIEIKKRQQHYANNTRRRGRVL